MAKRRTIKKVADKESSGCHCKWGMLKIASMAFILLLATIFPAFGRWLIGVPWWVYLIIFVVFCGIGMSRGCWCCKK
ncbi:MAG: hypothetical protein NTZ83_03980 [Candidatus Pacearchaeota archaeon]|nr:hypothetical protein [Candidatus Pacearchaeota archaeon]